MSGGGFKFWSKNQKPKRVIHTTAGANQENAAYFQCSNDECGLYLTHEDFVNAFDEPNYEDCPKCEVGYVYSFKEKNPLLEEYVDCLHFILSIGLELQATEIIIDSDYTEENTVKTFMKIYDLISIILMDVETDTFRSHIRPDYEELFNTFVGLGEKYLGFTWEQIEQAYLDKNKINHNRQANGY
ncbi:dUTP diphosphatase [Virgibacillus halophilus]|uniref:dUTP diphosphatase n=1 Tax=Tigheibacillus halophilus TaxID=361280 RepID=A0ABU5CDZ7_9BACI|nr:dUTP diphosphatase [Virgibacillus halophilus]